MTNSTTPAAAAMAVAAASATLNSPNRARTPARGGRRWRRARDDRGRCALGARSLCALETRAIFRREQRGEHEADRASSLREWIGGAEGDGRITRGTSVDRDDVETCLRALLVGPRDPGDGVRVLRAARVGERGR